MVWAGLLVAVLYSPVGSPDLYVPVSYNGANQGIDIAGVEFGNKPGISNSNGGNAEAMPSMSSDYSSRTGGSSSSFGGSSTQYSAGSGSFGGTSGMSKSNGASSGMGGGTMSGFSSGSSKKSDGGSTASGGGIMSMSSNQSTLENNSVTTKQAVGYSGGTGGTDPGDDPSGGTIPVGDGWIFLLVLLSVYTIYRKVRL